MSYIKKAWQKLTPAETEALKKRYAKGKEPVSTDTIITEYKEVVKIETMKDGTQKQTITAEPIKTNLTKKINETAKKLKIDNTLAILDKIGIMEDN